MPVKKIQNYFFQILPLILMVILFFVLASSFSNAQEQPTPETITPISEIPTAIPTLIDTPVFNVDSQSSTLLTPTFNDGSTNIAFYMKCPSEACPDDGTLESPVFIFSAENLGHGSLPFSDYWTPPFPSDYIAIEYKNDAQQFSCSSISFAECLSDTRFINVFHFTLIDNATVITPELIASKASLNNPSLPELGTENSTTSTALLQLSITLSSTSISSNLDNGLIVTASLDGIASIATSSIFETATSAETKTDIGTSTEDVESSSVGSFIMDIIESVIEIFTPEEEIIPELIYPEPNLEQSTTTDIINESILENEIESNSDLTEPITELEPVETNTNELVPEIFEEADESTPTVELPNNEIITTEF